MTDRFPLGFDREHHARLRRLYGDLVPPLECIRIRPGLYDLVDLFFACLGRLQPRRDLRVRRIETRNAGFLVIDLSGSAPGADDVVAEAEVAARHLCEHCGGIGRMVVKVGLETKLANSGLELRDRLLCLDCAAEFRKEIG